MAEEVKEQIRKIEPGTPRPPQARKQIMDASGNFHPAPDIPQVREPAPVEPAIPEFKIGDAVLMTGRVVEVHSPQGGQTSVKVQMEGQAEWFRAGHLQHDTAKGEAEAAKQAHAAEIEALKQGHEAQIAAAKAEQGQIKAAHSDQIKALEDKIAALQTEAKAAATENK